MNRANVVRFAVLMAGSLLLATSGCNLIPFVSNEERVQVASIRTLKNTLTPALNKSFGLFLRESGTLLSYGIPTRFGIDVAPYLAALPEVTLGRPTLTPSFDVDPSSRELRRIYSGTQLSIESTTAAGTSQGSYVYTLNARQTPLGTTGQLAVTTAGTNWKPATGAPSNYVLNQGLSPMVPSSLNANLLMSLPQSAGQIKMSALLSQFEAGNSAPVPRDVTFSFATPNINVQLSGAFGGLQSVNLSGTMTIKAEKGTENYQTRLTTANRAVELVMTNESRGFHLDLTYDGGTLSGTAKAVDGRQLELAKITQAAGRMPEIAYADGTKETWNFALPTN